MTSLLVVFTGATGCTPFVCAIVPDVAQQQEQANLVKRTAGSILGCRYEVVSLEADNQTAAGDRDAVINSNFISSELLSVDRQTTSRV